MTAPPTPRESWGALGHLGDDKREQSAGDARAPVPVAVEANKSSPAAATRLLKGCIFRV